MQQRALAETLTRYRQEWRYGKRCVCVDEERIGTTVDFDSSPEILPCLQDALSCLSDSDRHLIQWLFWEGWTEAEVARRLCISQQAVSKRKQAILHALCHWLAAL